MDITVAIIQRGSGNTLSFHSHVVPHATKILLLMCYFKYLGFVLEIFHALNVFGSSCT